MLGLTGIPAALQLILLPFFPESPRYMLIQRGDEKTAKQGKQTNTKTQLVDLVGSGRNPYDTVRCCLHPPLPSCSAAAAAWLGQRGGGGDGDASGRAIGARGGTPVRAQPAVPALPPLAADLHHCHEHGPAAVGSQRCESSHSLSFHHLSISDASKSSYLLICLSIYSFIYFNFKTPLYNSLYSCTNPILISDIALNHTLDIIPTYY